MTQHLPPSGLEGQAGQEWRGASYLEGPSHSPPWEERQPLPGVTRVCSRDPRGAPSQWISPARALDRDKTAHSTEEDTKAQEEAVRPEVTRQVSKPTGQM